MTNLILPLNQRQELLGHRVKSSNKCTSDCVHKVLIHWSHPHGNSKNWYDTSLVQNGRYVGTGGVVLTCVEVVLSGDWVKVALAVWQVYNTPQLCCQWQHSAWE